MPTRWSPDTCGCVLEFDVDASGDPQQTDTINVCPAHDGTLETVLAENQSKNRLHGWIVQNVSRLRHPSDDRLADGVEFRWEFTGSGASRKLAVWVEGASLTTAEKAQLRVFAAGELGRTVTVR